MFEIGFWESLLLEVSWIDFFDIGLVSFLIYTLVTVVRQTHTQFIAMGFGVVTSLYLLALTLGMRLTTEIFHLIFTVLVVVLAVLFQSEIRTFFERFADLVLWRRNKKKQSLTPDGLLAIQQAVSDFASDRIGALIVFQGKDNLRRWCKGGIHLTAKISEPLLKSIFDPHSIGHDGTGLVVDEEIEQFMCHLPLSHNAGQLGHRGTRHAAALGLSEKCDALCLVVSEERGIVTQAQHGKLTEIEDLDTLPERIATFQKETQLPAQLSFRQFMAVSDLHYKFLSVFVSMFMWFFFVHESNIEYRSFLVPLQSTGLPEGFKLENVTPKQVRVVVSAPRRNFYFSTGQDFPLVMRLFDLKEGTFDMTLVASDVNLPDGFHFENIWPRNVRVKVKKHNEPPKKPFSKSKRTPL